MKKFMTLFLSVMLLMSGCGNKDEYIRSTEPGKIIPITLSEMEEKMNHEDSFAISFVTSYCMYCAQFHSIFDEYIKNHEVVMYQVMLDDEPTSAEENRVLINKYFPEFSTTPGIFYVENGKEKDYLDVYHLGMSEELIDEWVVEFHLDQQQ